MDYISRDAAISKIRDQGVLGGDYDAYEREEDVVDMLNSIPAADVVEVVRCRDCVFGNMPCAMARYPDYFCADGKRKDGGQTMYEALCRHLRSLAKLWGVSTPREAADAIEELVGKVEQLPRWIPVTERLPDYPGRFMCYYEVNDYGENGHCIDWGMYDPDDGWYVSGVTHWMPLPEPPEEE